jgi:hypothetical protein
MMRYSKLVDIHGKRLLRHSIEGRNYWDRQKQIQAAKWGLNTGSTGGRDLSRDAACRVMAFEGHV